ncbi:MAG: DHH family phosphoesterase [Promethearchaeota archaeon]|jgi:nanoRNase/pAp phosphatase (c-di-AMP/oligoRNAs hydrolase)
MSISKFEDFLSFLEGKKILLTTHDLVDIDGLVSCYALYQFLETYFKNPVLSIYFSNVSKDTKNFIKRFNQKFPSFNFNYSNNVKFSDFEVCIIVDTSNIKQIRTKDGNDNPVEIPYFFIDHHHYPEDSTKRKDNTLVSIINEQRSSTAEIILELFEVYNQELTLPYKILIIAAILTDSGFFKYGSNETIKNVSKLVDEDVDIQEIQRMLEKDTDISERIAKIKGSQRVRIVREGDFLIGISNASSFGAKIASTLLNVGFDISIIYSIQKKETTINARARKSVCKSKGLHLGKIMEELSKEFNGSGGGHDGAASLTVKINLDILLEKLILKIKQAL